MIIKRYDFVYILMLFANSCGLDFRGQNVCSKYENGVKREYFCFNHYYDKGECKVCKPGTWTSDGLECKLCANDLYGYQCQYRCNCVSDQKCDAVKGCVNNDPEHMTVLHTKEPIRRTMFSTQFHNATTPVFITTKIQQTNFDRTWNNSDIKTDLNENLRLTYYMVIAGGVVGWLVFSFAVVRCIFNRVKRTRRRSENSINVHPSENENPVNMSLPVLPTENIYDLIDEEPTSQVVPEFRNSYLTVVDCDPLQDGKEKNSKEECEVSSEIEEQKLNDLSDKIQVIDGLIEKSNSYLSVVASEKSEDSSIITKNPETEVDIVVADSLSSLSSDDDSMCCNNEYTNPYTILNNCENTRQYNILS